MVSLLLFRTLCEPSLVTILHSSVFQQMDLHYKDETPFNWMQARRMAIVVIWEHLLDAPARHVTKPDVGESSRCARSLLCVDKQLHN